MTTNYTVTDFIRECTNMNYVFRVREICASIEPKDVLAMLDKKQDSPHTITTTVDQLFDLFIEPLINADLETRFGCCEISEQVIKIDEPNCDPKISDVCSENGDAFSVKHCKMKKCPARYGNECPKWLFYRRFRKEIDNNENMVYNPLMV